MYPLLYCLNMKSNHGTVHTYRERERERERYTETERFEFNIPTMPTLNCNGSKQKQKYKTQKTQPLTLTLKWRPCTEQLMINPQAAILHSPHDKSSGIHALLMSLNNYTTQTKSTALSSDEFHTYCPIHTIRCAHGPMLFRAACNWHLTCVPANFKAQTLFLAPKHINNMQFHLYCHLWAFPTCTQSSPEFDGYLMRWSGTTSVNTGNWAISTFHFQGHMQAELNLALQSSKVTCTHLCNACTKL